MIELMTLLLLLVNDNTAFPADHLKAADSSLDMQVYDDYFKDSYELPSDKSDDTNKVFGGDRSDTFLYPPQSYYQQWAKEERDKDYWDYDDC